MNVRDGPALELAMFLYISFRDEATKDWHSAIARELTRSAGLAVCQVRGARVVMSSGEVVAVSVDYTPASHAVSIHAALDGVQLIGVNGFKTQESGFDPTVVCRTPGGMYISIMLGPMQPGDRAADERDG
jgi:hypothetical protein